MNKQLEMDSRFSGKAKLELEINAYRNNNRMYIGLVEVGGEYSEHFADLTVNISAPCPDYCGYVDINNCPELEGFIEEHELGSLPGLWEEAVSVLIRCIFLTRKNYVKSLQRIRHCLRGRSWG